MTPEERRARARMKAAWKGYHDRNSIRCARCGHVRGHVSHETDRKHAPEGPSYYLKVPFCEFASTRPDIVTTAREAPPSRDVGDYFR